MQRLCGGAVLEYVVMETGELLSHVLDAPPSYPPVLHTQQLGAQVVEPQHVGVGLVVCPVVAMGKERQNTEQVLGYLTLL